MLVIITRITSDMVEDDFKKGELPNTERGGVNDPSAIVCQSIEKAVEAAGKQYGLSEDPKEWAMDDGLRGRDEVRLIYTHQVDSNHLPASAEQRERWKRGEIKLYDERWTVHCLLAEKVEKQYETASAEAKALGVDRLS